VSWNVEWRPPARRAFRRAPLADALRLDAAIHDMQRDPLSGDVQRLHGRNRVWRRRVGPWRVFFTLNWERRIVTVTAIERRTSTTY